MNLAQLRRENAISVYQAILNDINTISMISKATGISRLTVCEVANQLASRELIEITKPRRNMRGRRVHHYVPSNKYFSIFIDIQKQYFSAIGISTSGDVVERFDYPIRYEERDSQEVLNLFVMRKIRNSPNYKYCTSIFLLGDKNHTFTVDDDVIKTTKEELIANSLADKHKVKLFDFEGKYIMSLYSHLHFPDLPKEQLLKAITFDEICTFTGNFYFDAFEALKLIAREKLLEII